MKKDNFYKKAFLLTVLAIAGISSIAPVTYANETETRLANQSSTREATLLAALTGQCRRANRALGIFSGRAETAGTRVGVVQTGEIVRLADEGSQGWIGVDFPQAGFVQASGLVVTPCPSNLGQTPGTDGNLCRRVARPPEGLVVRATPNTNSALVGGVAQGQNITLTTNPATTSKDSAGRTWIQISAPAQGWVSNGLPSNGVGHIVFCSGDQTPPPPPPNRCRRIINPPEGVVIRSQPSRTAGSVVGGVGLNERITLTTVPPTVNRDAEGRNWVQIEAPRAGWVSNGLGGQSNIGLCP